MLVSRRAGAEGEKTTDEARKLRDLAAWYREFAERAGDPWIWDARLRTADKLEKEAALLWKRTRPGKEPLSRRKGPVKMVTSSLISAGWCLWPVRLPDPAPPSRFGAEQQRPIRLAHLMHGRGCLVGGHDDRPFRLAFHLPQLS
jgi:hypothetical protein